MISGGNHSAGGPSVVEDYDWIYGEEGDDVIFG